VGEPARLHMFTSNHALMFVLLLNMCGPPRHVGNAVITFVKQGCGTEIENKRDGER